MKYYLVIIGTEDGEDHKYLFDYKPDKKEVKKMFFDDNGSNYKKMDWGELYLI